MDRLNAQADRALRTALAACAGCGWATASITLLHGIEHSAPRAIACIALLIFGPLYESHLAGWIARLPRFGARLARAVWLLEVLPIAFLPAGPSAAFLLGAVILAQGHLFTGGEDDRYAVGCLLLPPLLAVTCVALVQAPLLLVMVPASVAMSLVALVVLHGRLARRRVRRLRPDAESAAGRRARLGFAASLSAATLSVAVLAFLGLDRIAEAIEREPERNGVAGAEPVPAVNSGETPDGVAEMRDWDVGQALGLSSPSVLSDVLVMRVLPVDGGTGFTPGSPLYMRNSVLDRIGSDGVSLHDRTHPPLMTDGTDGQLDGWTRVRASGTSAGASTSTVRLTVEVLRPSIITAQAWTLLFSPHPLAAVSLPSVRYSVDSVFVEVGVELAPFAYDLECEPRRLTTPGLESAAAQHPDPRFLQLPDDAAAMAWIGALARETTRGARSDVQRVVRVLAFFKQEFEYGFEVLGFRGTRAIVQFLEHRRGHCTQFASAATLMLRSLGIASRVATGYLASEWDEGLGAYLVRERHAHAWVEVHFEGIGWVTLDPTAEDLSSRALALLLGDVGMGWYERLRQTLGGWMESGGETVSLGDVVSALAFAPLGFLGDHPSAWLIVVAALLAVLHLLLRRRGTTDTAGAFPSPLPAPTARLHERLVRALAARGHRRARAETPREFARAVSLAEGRPFLPLRDVVELFYRARFGHTELSKDEERFVEGFVRQVLETAAET